MKVTELLEARLLGQGMSKAARAADVEQSDREYIAQRQAREKLTTVADELRKHSSIASADVDQRESAIDVTTKKGDIVRFVFHEGQFYAWVQGQKSDIACDEQGKTAADLLAFLKGINKAWYREYDEDFDEALEYDDEPLLTEGFWAVTNKYRLSDDPRKDSKNGEDFLSLSGDYMRPGIKNDSPRSIKSLNALLTASKGEVTDAVLAWNGSASIRKWLKWVKENGRKVKLAAGRYVDGGHWD